MKQSQSILRTLAILGSLIAMTSLGFAEDPAAGKLSKHDNLKIAAQKICPVTGKPLGSMGTPLKAKIGKEELFLCCQGCLTGQVDKAHWATVHANLARAQGKCPVMGHDLPKNPKWTIVNGQIVYVCCPPCTKKVEADPRAYLTKLDKLYEASEKKQQAATNGTQSPR